MMVGSLKDWPQFFLNCFEYVICKPLDHSLLMLFIRNIMPDGIVEVMAPHCHSAPMMVLYLRSLPSTRGLP